VTPPDDLIRESLRDLIPAYSGPPDPYARVGATIVRRRRVHRRLVAASAMAAVVGVAGGVPAALRLARPATPASGVPAAGRPSPGAGRPEVPLPPGQVVASGAVAGAVWTVVEGPLSTDARRCLRADDAVFHGAAVCFDDWRAGQPPAWHQMVALRPGVAATAYFGVAPRYAEVVKLVLSDGRTYAARATRVDGEPAASFFAVVAPRPHLGLVALHTYAANGTEIGRPVAGPGASGCDPAVTIC
jgi:hypothetical protein